MLNSIKITNFHSIGETQEIFFNISSEDIIDNSSTTISNHNINLVNCIVGGNASGKTTILKAMSFLFWFINDSYTDLKSDEKIPVDAHKLHTNDRTILEIEFFNADTLYQYKIELDEKQIYKESLSSSDSKKYNTIFEYDRFEEKWNFTSIKINENDLNRFKDRKNTSVLSSLVQTGYLPNLSSIKAYTSNVDYTGRRSENLYKESFLISEILHEDIEIQEKVLSFVRDIDIGVSHFTFTDVDTIERNKKTKYLECVHQSENETFQLPLINESNGTVHSLQLLVKIIPILKNGGIAILDEIEVGLHPHLIKKIIYLFENKATNPHNAQLIFSTHQVMLLGDRTKTQIFIAEKSNQTFETEIFRLDEVEGVKDDENYANHYLAGAYGGIPNMKWFKA